MKLCPDCQTEYPATLEYFHRRGNDKLNTYCKPCANARARAHHHANRSNRLVYLAAYRDANRDKLRTYKRDMDKKRADNRAYHAANRDQLNQEARRRYQRNKPRYVQRAYKWQRNNPDKARAYTRVKALRRRGAPLTTEARQYIEIIKHDPCVYCGQYGDIVIDHIHPVSRGGDSDWTNLAPACRSCNAAKTNKSLLAYLLERGELWS